MATSWLFVLHLFLFLNPVYPILTPNDDIANLQNTVTLLKETLKSTTDQLQSVKDELFAMKTELQSTSAQLITLKSDVTKYEKDCQNDTKMQLNKLESEMVQMSSSKSNLQSGETSTQPPVIKLGHGGGSNPSEFENIKAQMENITKLSNRRNVGFLVSSQFGDNGSNHTVSFHLDDSVNLKFSQVSLNQGNIYGRKTGTMTASVTGVYLIWFDINMQRTDKGPGVRLVKSPLGDILAEESTHNGRVVFNLPVYLKQWEAVAVQLVSYNFVMRDTPASVFGGVLIREF